MKFLARQKYLFDQGAAITSQLVGIFNTCLLIISVSDKITHRLGVDAWVFMAAAVAAYLFGTLALGYYLDRSSFLLLISDEHNARNNAMQKIMTGER